MEKRIFRSLRLVYFQPLSREKFCEIIKSDDETTKNWRSAEPAFDRFSRLVIKNLREKNPLQKWEQVQLVVSMKKVSEDHEFSPPKMVLSANILQLGL